jgi:hypothetical protein
MWQENPCLCRKWFLIVWTEYSQAVFIKPANGNCTFLHYVVSVAQNLVQKTNGYIVTFNSSKEKLESLKQDKTISSQVGWLILLTKVPVFRSYLIKNDSLWNITI